jgi:hypothetical protein
MELCVVGGPAKGHRSLGADRAGGSCGPAKVRDGAAAVESPSVSLSSAMSFTLSEDWQEDIAALAQTGQGATADRPVEGDGTMAGHGAP